MGDPSTAFGDALESLNPTLGDADVLPDGIDLTLVTAHALLGGREKVDVLDQMLTTAVKRRQKAAQEFETRRLAFAFP